MEHLLQKVSGARVVSFLDGLGYNHIVVHPEDQENTAFTTPWGTFMYSKVPFGLTDECWGYFSEGHGHSLFGREGQVCRYLP